MRYEPIAAADLPRYLTEVGGTPHSAAAPDGSAWWVAVPELPDAILTLTDHFEIEFIPEET